MNKSNLIFKDYYFREETELVLTQIDWEISQKIKRLHIPCKNKKNIGKAFIQARVQDLENWRLHYLENTFV